MAAARLREDIIKWRDSSQTLTAAPFLMLFWLIMEKQLVRELVQFMKNPG